MLRATFVPSNTGYSVSFYLSGSPFSVTGFNAYNLGLSFNPVLAELLTSATTTNSGDLPSRFAGDIVAVNTQRLSAGEIQVAGLSSRAEALPASTALGTLPFGNVASAGLSVTVNKLVVGTDTYIQSDKPLTFNSDGSRFTPDIYSFPFNRSAANLQFNTQDSRWSFTDANGTAINLNSFKRVEFADANIALDINGASGQAYRIYKAAFNREPDKGGLGFWIARMDAGQDIVKVASGFVGSAEFRSLYGDNPTNDFYLTKLYQNVLGRDAEPEGYNWWLNEIQTNPTKTRAQVLADFAESNENKAGTAQLIGQGITYDPWLG